MLWSGTVLILMWLASGYFWLLALEEAAAGIVNCIFEFSVAICYIFSILILPQYEMSWIKNMSVTICLCGVSLVGYASYNTDDGQSGTTLLGLVWTFIATACFGIGKPLIALFADLYFPVLSPIQSALFMQGFLGILAVFVVGPGIVVMHLSGIEPFELPSWYDVLTLVSPSTVCGHLIN